MGRPYRTVQLTRQKSYAAQLPYMRAGYSRVMMAAEDTSQKSARARAKEFATLYGGSYLGTSTAMAVVSYAVWYALIKAGVDVVALMQGLGDWLATTPVGRPALLDKVNETIGTAALAYIAHKASSPLRFPLTIAATPIVAKAFSKKGDGEDGEAESAVSERKKEKEKEKEVSGVE